MNKLIVYSVFIALTISFLACGGKEGVVNQAPSDPYDPVPADGAVDVEIPVTLEWSADDPDGDELAYKVKIGSEPAKKRPSEMLSANEYTPDNLDPGTTYYWSVLIEDGEGGYTDGPNKPNYWTFTTAGEPPEENVEEAEDTEGETE
ncbi:MAG: hypothetical protein GY771_16320 [bacterium]|nr:hypothetical protein [bacterium]